MSLYRVGYGWRCSMSFLDDTQHSRNRTVEKAALL